MTNQPESGEGAVRFPLERVSRFFSLLNEGNQAFLFDGGVATQLYEKGVFINRSFDEVNLSQPELITNIHKQYIQSGAQVVTTNTWGANRIKLRNYGLDSQLLEINLRGAQIARAVAGDVVWVAGCLGPLGVRIEPWGPTSFDEAKEFFFEQAKALQQGGVDLFVLEGFADLNEIHQAIRAVKSLGDYPVVAMMATNDDGQTLYGTEPEWFVRKLDEWGADVVGVNGGNGPAPLLELAKRLKSSTNKPLILKPNAGLPRQVDGRLIYMASPEYMGEFARQALLQDVRVLGGCSGTTPQHIRAMSGALRQGAAFRGGETFRSTVSVSETNSVQAKPTDQDSSSQWSRGLAGGKFVVSVELLPPKGLDTDKLLERSAQCKKAGVDAINIPDGPRASARMSALAAACLIEQKIGIETVLHYACRDRNILGIQSDLIGAAGLGLKNILCVTGDPPKLGPYPTATAVFDIDAIGLVNMASRLNSGLDLGGTSIGRSTGFSIGVGANPVAPDLKKEFERFRYKVEAGAQWAITQPVFDSESLLRFLDFSSQFRVPIIAGIWPLMSLRNAEFMANEVPGVYVPEKLLERMRACKTTEDQRKEGLQIAFELISDIRKNVQGLQISAPLGQVELALALI
ncbi:MAG: bifunctional homocysteine S-methyltransferase/methylenetetrahydrofolate reductase [Silvanigrellaceae bacterium]